MTTTDANRDALPMLTADQRRAVRESGGTKLLTLANGDVCATLHPGVRANIGGRGTTDAIAAMRLADHLRQLADEIDQAIGRRPDQAAVTLRAGDFTASRPLQ